MMVSHHIYSTVVRKCKATELSSTVVRSTKIWVGGSQPANEGSQRSDVASLNTNTIYIKST